MTALQLVRIFSYSIALLGFISLVRHLNPVTSVIFVLSAIAGFIMDEKDYYPVKRWLLNISGIVVLILAFMGISREDFISPLLNALTLLQVIKLIGEKKIRDHYQIYLLSLFMLAGATTQTIDMIYATFLIGEIIIGATGLVVLNFYRTLIPKKSFDFLGYPTAGNIPLKWAMIKRFLSVTIILPLLSIPLSAVFFIILPRTTMPIWLFGLARYYKTGFTNEVTIGKIGEIQETGDVAFRAVMPDITDPSSLANDLYWRGIIFDRYENNTWMVYEQARFRMPQLNIPVHSQGNIHRQIIYLEPQGERYLFTLDKPLTGSFPSRFIMLSDSLMIEMPHIIESRIRYEVYSISTPYLPSKEDNIGRYLQLPEEFPGSIKRLAVDITRGTRSTEETVKKIELFLKKGEYTYTLSLPEAEGDPIESFIFRSKRGNCEYFASSLVLMLRSIGIPARIVGGYLGGEWNPVGKYFLVRQSSAHTWAEAYIPEKGWIRLDPTPQVLTPPIRVSYFSLFIDHLRLRWYTYIIGYDIGKQISIAMKTMNTINRTLSLKPHIDTVKVFRIAIVFLTAGGLFFIILSIYRRIKVTPSILYSMFLSRMEKLGFKKGIGEGPLEFAERVISINPQFAPAVNEFTRIFIEIRYGGKVFDKESKKRLITLIHKIRRR